MNRTTLSLIAGVTALAAVTGFAAVSAPDPGAAEERPGRRPPLPVERTGLLCPQPSTSDLAETTYTSFTPVTEGADDKGTAVLRPRRPAGGRPAPGNRCRRAAASAAPAAPPSPAPGPRRSPRGWRPAAPGAVRSGRACPGRGGHGVGARGLRSEESRGCPSMRRVAVVPPRRRTPTRLPADPRAMSERDHFSQGWARFRISPGLKTSRHLTVFMPTGDRNQNRPKAAVPAYRLVTEVCFLGYVGRFTPRHGGVTWWRVVAARSRVRYRPTS
ncbi:hypothetical protein SALBM217S_06965 [Streptomyces griseoloalbus]